MLTRGLYMLGRSVREAAQALDRVGQKIQGQNFFREELSRHRRLMPLYDVKPKLGDDIFIAPSAAVIGDVTLDESASVWYGAVLRGDVSSIKIGARSSILDNAVIHGSSAESGQKTSTYIETDVVVEPGSILHGCTIKSGSRIGSGSVILDNAVVGNGAVVAPGSVVTSGKTIPAHQLWSGSPAQFVRDLSSEEKAELVEGAAHLYNLSKKHETEHRKNEQQRYEEALFEDAIFIRNTEHPYRF
eukprot:CAMPEP_0184334806 /NCGR_PEP_ID=MMETSP1089-20130417/3472_1 /TAXON_ID=38269 ORGANISM="Gloeochaete wittrockiana, Strain SAG46.84" /NCGR_SAMPLE_ID=MMETSP1089 /ASSEMBLY_ACC=CAM_ASM_000445 /LENGTH=243 /DNA_ID=CAMNT_0026659177 /DNA_START=75 /DNA_END=806 /DNA_ORIENTATION=+